MALSVKRIEKLKDMPGRHGDGHGLYLQVPKREEKDQDGAVVDTWAGAPSWLFRYERDGRERWLGLGSENAFNLHEARERARKMRQLLADGIDPAAARKAERAERALAAARTVTFKEASAAYFDAHNTKWRNDKHRDQYLSTMKTYVEPEIGRLAMAAVMDRMGVTGATVHGFRSSFRSWAAETTNHPREVCEMALAHVVGDAVERAYQRGDMFEKRRRLARDWERYCASPPRSGNNVVPINRSAAE